MPYAVYSKIVFTTAWECIAKYREKGIEADTLLFACNPQYHNKRVLEEQYKYDIIFVGSNYDVRYQAAENMILPFVQNQYNIKIWGLWWQDKNRPINIADCYYGGLMAYEDLPGAYSSAKIILGLHCDDSSSTQTSMRTFEALGCGGFYLTQYTPAHQQLFENKKHLVWSKSAGQTRELADYYLNREDERIQIAKAGQKYVYQNHTYYQRAAKVLSIAEKIL